MSHSDGECPTQTESTRRRSCTPASYGSAAHRCTAEGSENEPLLQVAWIAGKLVVDAVERRRIPAFGQRPELATNQRRFERCGLVAALRFAAPFRVIVNRGNATRSNEASRPRKTRTVDPVRRRGLGREPLSGSSLSVRVRFVGAAGRLTARRPPGESGEGGRTGAKRAFRATRSPVAWSRPECRSRYS